MIFASRATGVKTASNSLELRQDYLYRMQSAGQEVWGHARNEKSKRNFDLIQRKVGIPLSQLDRAGGLITASKGRFFSRFASLSQWPFLVIRDFP